jgi:enoyl-CoA hydratase/carnithine racemase
MPGLSVERRGAIAILLIENEGRRNCLTAEMWQQVEPILDALAADETVTVLIVAGVGDDFSAGADIRDLDQILNVPTGADGGWISAAENALARFAKPTIAAIDGYCVGGGWELAGACDIRIASSRASFGVTPSRIGIVYPLSGIERLVAIAGPAVAKLLLFSGDLVSASDAQRFGMVSRVVEADALLPEALAFAALLANRSQLSIRAMKNIVDAIDSGSDAEAVAARWQAEVAASDEPAIGAAAFIDKERPEFTWRAPASHR